MVQQNLILHRLCCAWCLHGAELSLGHFGTSADGTGTELS